ncbi:response regulator transcription factor [Myxococcota bacterium]|nr:response regulator transcription factor [Myxococcota bacterium]MBU1533756.1 response regulator transcription factor [Myxococcota bacterium]
MTLNVYICEDSKEFQENLTRFLPKFGDISVVGNAWSAEEALADASLALADVMLLDLEMPGKGGLWAIGQIVARENPPEILVLTTHQAADSVFLAITRGAAGYIIKGAPFKKLVAGIQDIAQGGTVIDPELASRFWHMFSSSVGFGQEVSWSLTEGEIDILTMVAKGLSNPEVGEALGKSRTNVKKILARIFKKLSVNSRVEAVTMALRAGIISME